MLFDVFDGQVARIAKVTSDFGAQLDSLCDLVSFGVAPGILLVKMCPQFAEVHREAIWCIAAVFACCAAMRLARFNVETDEGRRPHVVRGPALARGGGDHRQLRHPLLRACATTFATTNFRGVRLVAAAAAAARCRW